MCTIPVFILENNVQSDRILDKIVVKKLTELIQDVDVVLCFDTSIHLLDTLPYAAVGRCIKIEKNVPKSKLQRKDSEMIVCK